MNWKNFFKLTKGKIIFSIIATLVWIFLKISTTRELVCDCASGGFEGCTDYSSLLIIKQAGCHCSCVPIVEVISQYFTIIIIPFVIAYFLYSVISVIIRK